MEFLVVTPTRGDVLTGNRCTAKRWAQILRGLGHDVAVASAYRGQSADVLIALHGSKSHASISAFRRATPNGTIVLALTGTDIYPELDDQTRDSLRLSDRIVALQPRVRDRVPADCRDRLRIIVQSATALAQPSARAAPREPGDGFGIAVVSHMRAIKDPLRAAAASRLLPRSSRICVRHAGAILCETYRELVDRELAENHRYRWLGEIPPAEARQLMAESLLVIVASRHEGGARVIGESLAAGTPVLAARNDASESLLGDDYPGLFAVGATDELASLMTRAETDTAFYSALCDRARALSAQFEPERETAAWRALVDGLALD